MGTIHLVGVGLSPGAATVGILLVSLGKFQRLFNPPELPGGVEEVIIITSRYIASSRLKEINQGRQPDERVLVYFQSNDVTSRVEHKTIPEIVSDVIKEHVQPKDGICMCVVENPNDYQEIFFKVSQLLRENLGLGGEKGGKNTWLNVTGGTNPMNMALITAAQVYGAGIAYYTYVKPGFGAEKYVIPPDNANEYFSLFIVPLIPAALDQTYLITLQYLDGRIEGVKTEEIVNQVFTTKLNLDESIAKWKIKKMDSHEMIDWSSDQVKITEKGRRFLEFIRKLSQGGKVECIAL